jgi:hypothetical protein
MAERLSVEKKSKRERERLRGGNKKARGMGRG